MPEERGDSRFSSFLIGFLVGVIFAAVGAGGYSWYRERQAARQLDYAKRVRLDTSLKAKWVMLRVAEMTQAAKAAEMPKE